MGGVRGVRKGENREKEEEWEGEEEGKRARKQGLRIKGWWL